MAVRAVVADRGEGRVPAARSHTGRCQRAVLAIVVTGKTQTWCAVAHARVQANRSHRAVGVGRGRIVPELGDVVARAVRNGRVGRVEAVQVVHELVGEHDRTLRPRRRGRVRLVDQVDVVGLEERLEVRGLRRIRPVVPRRVGPRRRKVVRDEDALPGQGDVMRCG